MADRNGRGVKGPFGSGAPQAGTGQYAAGDVYFWNAQSRFFVMSVKGLAVRVKELMIPVKGL
jgi:hypothetical protein